jgi:hypothetical protein
MSIDEMASRLIGSEGQVLVARVLAWMWRCLLAGALPSEELRQPRRM